MKCKCKNSFCFDDLCRNRTANRLHTNCLGVKSKFIMHTAFTAGLVDKNLEGTQRTHQYDQSSKWADPLTPPMWRG